MCMEAFLQGQDIWDLVTGVNAEIPADTYENVEVRRKWKIKCEKTLFALRTSISKEFIDHVRDVNSPKQLWETFERLFSKKNTAQALVKQMAKSHDPEAVLFSKGKHYKKNTYKEEWIVDPGCSHHVIGNDSLFSELRQHKQDRVIVTADDSAYPVAKERDVHIGIDARSLVKLSDVFHVPGLKRNLV
ncbi:hypothetical protein ES319_A11G300900v1, partial [Gossypium barbadense]